MHISLKRLVCAPHQTLDKHEIKTSTTSDKCFTVIFSPAVCCQSLVCFKWLHSTDTEKNAKKKNVFVVSKKKKKKLDQVCIPAIVKR